MIKISPTNSSAKRKSKETAFTLEGTFKLRALKFRVPFQLTQAIELLVVSSILPASSSGPNGYGFRPHR